ncbi:hypothetical protein BGZ95_003180 [Linnemannia exigua]|uniref:Peptide hydrolase n=1 Tax=Linnemannia exigua TaxID=604196 RepID=A0AAD4DIC7_9FUNG|nr:hypothetical protein BGZ95_003180 [Linnemannia exigua]
MATLKKRHANAMDSKADPATTNNKHILDDDRRTAARPGTAGVIAERILSPKTALFSWTVFIGFIAFFIFVAYGGHYTLPTPVMEEHHPVTGKPQISEAYMRRITGHLSETIGLRVSGTAQDAETERFLINEIAVIEEKARIARARGATDLPKIDTWVQVDDGSHQFDFMHEVVMKMYSNLTNIVVRLSCGPECDENALLLNAHYDTTLGSPGAVDDGVGVAVMMDVLRVMSLSPSPKKNSVIFLFNGAEESFQDASHSFIVNHELKGSVRAVVNVEGTGTHGPEILFQANARVMIDAYSKAPYPHGTVLANDLFETGIILGDSDFRIFRDHGNITGIDMAIYKNSYLYHTQLDINENMQVGVPQHTGENVFAIVNYVADEVDLRQIPEMTNDVVYFDVAGLFFVTYSAATAIKMHIVFGIAALAAFLVGASRPSIKSFLSIPVSLFAAVVGPFVLATLFVSLGKPMQWFSHEWYPFFIFGPTAIAGMLAVQYAVHDPKASTGANELSVFSGVQVFFTALLGLATNAGLGGSYILAMFSISLTVALIFNRARVGTQKQISGQSEQMVVHAVGFSTYLIASAIPTTYFATVAYTLIDVLVPLTGRMGPSTPVDHLVAGLVGLVAFLVCPSFLAFAHRFGRPILLKAITILLLVQIPITLFSLVALTPYNHMHPKRMFIQHLRNTTSGETAVYLAHADQGAIYDSYIAPLEQLLGVKAVYKTSKEDKDDWNSVFPISEFIDSYVIDTTPFIRSQTTNKTIAESTAPLTDLIKNPPRLTAENISYDPTTGLRKVTLLCTFPDHIWTVITFDALLKGWSLSSKVPSPDQFHYVIRNAGGYGTDGWRLDLEYAVAGEMGANDKLRIEMISMETEGFDWRVEEERELEGTGEIGIMRKIINAQPDFMALTYMSTVATVFNL